MSLEPLKSHIPTNIPAIASQSNITHIELKTESTVIRQEEIERSSSKTSPHRPPDAFVQKVLESLSKQENYNLNFFQGDGKDYLRGDPSHSSKNDGLYIVQTLGDKTFAFFKAQGHVLSKECSGQETTQELQNDFLNKIENDILPNETYTIPIGAQKRIDQAIQEAKNLKLLNGSSTTVAASHIASKAEKKSRGLWSILDKISTCIKTKEFFDGIFSSAINSIKEAWASSKNESNIPKDAQKIKMKELDFKAILGSNVFKPKQHLRWLLSTKHGELKEAIAITYSQAKNVEELKSKTLKSDNIRTTLTFTSKPYGSDGERDSHLILIAGDRLQGGVLHTAKLAQEETANEEHPVLVAIGSQRLMKEMRTGTNNQGIEFAGQGQSLGAFIKGVPQQCKINTYKEFSYSTNLEIKPTNIAGDNFKKTFENYQKETGEGEKEFIDMLIDKGIIEIFEEPKIHNILYMVAPRAYNQATAWPKEIKLKELNNQYEIELKLIENLDKTRNASGLTSEELLNFEERIKKAENIKNQREELQKDLDKIRQITAEQGYDLFNAFTQPFIAAIKNGETTLPFGPVGTGAFNNNYQFSLIQGLLAANYAAKTEGVNVNLHYHDPEVEGLKGQERQQDFAEAMTFFNDAIQPMIENGNTLEEIMQAVVAHAQSKGWKNSPVSTN
jgi:hypothetical protein